MVVNCPPYGGRAELPKLSGVISVPSVQLSQFESNMFFSAIAETLVKQELPA